jgi:hypothetical protein
LLVVRTGEKKEEAENKCSGYTEESSSGVFLSRTDLITFGPSTKKKERKNGKDLLK